jgi:hypothetical protein
MIANPVILLNQDLRSLGSTTFVTKAEILNKQWNAFQKRITFIVKIYQHWQASQNYLHWAESFLKSWQSIIQSRNSSPFMETACSLLCSQEPACTPYPTPDKSSPTLTPCFLRYILILSYLRPSLPSDMFPSGVLTTTFYAFLISVRCTSCPPIWSSLKWSP